LSLARFIFSKYQHYQSLQFDFIDENYHHRYGNPGNSAIASHGECRLDFAMHSLHLKEIRVWICRKWSRKIASGLRTIKAPVIVDDVSAGLDDLQVYRVHL